MNGARNLSLLNVDSICWLCEDELFERVDLYRSRTHGAEDAAVPILLEDSEIDIIGIRISPIRTSPDLRKPDARRKAASGSSVLHAPF